MFQVLIIYKTGMVCKYFTKNDVIVQNLLSCWSKISEGGRDTGLRPDGLGQRVRRPA